MRRRVWVIWLALAVVPIGVATGSVTMGRPASAGTAAGTVLPAPGRVPGIAAIPVRAAGPRGAIPVRAARPRGAVDPLSVDYPPPTPTGAPAPIMEITVNGRTYAVSCEQTAGGLTCTVTIPSIAMGSHDLVHTGFDPFDGVEIDLTWLSVGQATGAARTPPARATLAAVTRPGPRPVTRQAAPVVDRVLDQHILTAKADENGMVRHRLNLDRVGRARLTLDALPSNKHLILNMTVTRQLPTTGTRWIRVGAIMVAGGFAVLVGVGLVWWASRRRRQITPAS